MKFIDGILDHTNFGESSHNDRVFISYLPSFSWVSFNMDMKQQFTSHEIKQVQEHSKATDVPKIKINDIEGKESSSNSNPEFDREEIQTLDSKSEFDNNPQVECQIEDKIDFQQDQNVEEGVSDLILKLLVKRKPYRHYLDDSDAISKEESEERIFWLLTILAAIFSTVSIAMVSFRFSMMIQASEMTSSSGFTTATIPSNLTQQKLPHVLLIFHDGTIHDYPVEDEGDQQQAYFNLPKRKKDEIEIKDDYKYERYYGYLYHNELYVFDSNRKTEMTVFQANGKHRRLKNSKLIPSKAKQQSFARVGHFIWLIGGGIGSNGGMGAVGLGHEFYCSSSQKTYLWSIKKQTWLKFNGPDLPEHIGFSLLSDPKCVTAVNDSTVIFAGLYNFNNIPVNQVVAFHFTSQRWQELPKVPLEDDYFHYSCTTYFSKSEEISLATLVYHEYENHSGGHTLLNLHLKSQTWTNYGLQDPFFGTVVTIKNVVYLFSIYNNEFVSYWGYQQTKNDIEVHILNSTFQWTPIGGFDLQFEDTKLLYDGHIVPIVYYK